MKTGLLGFQPDQTQTRLYNYIEDGYNLGIFYLKTRVILSVSH